MKTIATHIELTNEIEDIMSTLFSCPNDLLQLKPRLMRDRGCTDGYNNNNTNTTVRAYAFDLIVEEMSIRGVVNREGNEYTKEYLSQVFWRIAKGASKMADECYFILKKWTNIFFNFKQSNNGRDKVSIDAVKSIRKRFEDKFEQIIKRKNRFINEAAKELNYFNRERCILMKNEKNRRIANKGKIFNKDELKQMLKCPLTERNKMIKNKISQDRDKWLTKELTNEQLKQYNEEKNNINSKSFWNSLD